MSSRVSVNRCVSQPNARVQLQANRIKRVAQPGAIINYHIGLEETDDGIWTIYFNTVLIATLNERDYIIRG